MGLLDVMSFKKDFSAVINGDNITLLKTLIKETIIGQVKAKYPGQEKMDKVISTATDFVKRHMSSKNKIVQWCVDTFIITSLRAIAQSIYDDLKEVVKGL